MDDSGDRDARQNPDYSVEDSFRDAIAVITAVMHEDEDPVTVQVALEAALDRTDHTNLVYNFGLLTKLLVKTIADGTGIPADEVLRKVALSVTQSTQPHDDTPGDAQ